MKTPDKIYVCIPQRLNLPTFKEDFQYVGMAYNDKGNLRSSQIEEYIRKDALMEWLKNEYETISWYYEKMKHVTGSIGDTSSSGKAEAYKKVIEKIESL